MKKILIFRALTAFALTLAVSMSAEAQLGNVLNKAKNAVKKETGQETETASPASTTTSAGATVAGKAKKPGKQPWTVSASNQGISKGDVKVTFADGVLTISGTGEMQDFRIDMHNDERPWAAHAAEIVSVAVEEGITSLGAFAFYGCANLTSVTLPETLTGISGAVFFGCKALTTISLPKGLTQFNTAWVPDGKGSEYLAGVFEQCPALAEIRVAAGGEKYKAVEGVLYEYFSTKWRLKAYPAGRKAESFTVPDQTPVVQTGAFANCEALKEITLPASCGEIQAGAFRNCVNLQTITLLQPTSPVSYNANAHAPREDAFYGVDKAKLKIVVPAKVVSAYKTRPDFSWETMAEQIVGK